MIQTMRLLQSLGDDFPPFFGGQNQDAFNIQQNLILQYREWWSCFRTLTEQLAKTQNYMPNANRNDPDHLDRQPAFVLESGISPALYLVARKCRHPVLRRRAIAALGQCAGQEGGWNTKQLFAIAKRNMELEEATLAHLPMEIQIPKDRDRIYGTFVMGGLKSPVEVIFRWRDSENNLPKDYAEFIKW
ncbi:hypothetical protein N7478_005430 [Penicillium angulare]|uniref:uncharacterized protein n=1 Tax=Penicillium angulare TaxID=116970 RepID=UPI00253FDBE9|nr:uncharacterized protein N7478_005430 [Penicillium angulare]KAJ5280058.1 hypothetical protein N7478_005430 [Penicillium angulare]